MKPFKNAKDVKKRNRQAFKRIQQLEEMSILVSPTYVYVGAGPTEGVYIRNYSSLRMRVKFE